MGDNGKNKRQKAKRLGEIRYDKQNCPMKIIEYNNAVDIIVEFQDKFKGKVHTTYGNFINLEIKNPYYPTVCGIGVTGNKYPTKINRKHVAEYVAWHNIISRSYNEKDKRKNPSYQNVACCEEWLNYENFYEWLHSQENFDKWLNGKGWAVDKDILVKGNKTYSPEYCCLVPQNVNSLFVKNDAVRSELPIGVIKSGTGFQAHCNNPFTHKYENLGTYQTTTEAFLMYKKQKEDIIKQVAQIEFDKCNITKECYDAMMNYEVEITD